MVRPTSPSPNLLNDLLPRYNLSTNTYRLSNRVCELLSSRINDLTMNLVRVTSIILINQISSVCKAPDDPIQTLNTSITSCISTITSLYVLPLSHVSMVARVSLCFSASSDNLYRSFPRSVATTFRQDLKAFLAALTAVSTSSADPAYTLTISDSFLVTLKSIAVLDL